MGAGSLYKDGSFKGVKFTGSASYVYSANTFVAFNGYDSEDQIVQVAPCGANAPAYGVVPTEMTAGVVDEILIGDGTVVELEVAGSVSTGDELSSDANGKGYKAVYIAATTATVGLSEAYVNAIALEDGVAGDVISVQLISPYKKQLS